MKKDKLDQLFGLARKAQPPAPTAGFEAEVLRAIRREPRGSVLEPSSLFDTLGSWFPRLAWAAALVIALCVVAHFALAAAGVPNLNEAVAQASEQWMFDSNAL